ncbi:MAG: hypothetical protein QME92_09010 [Bacillota bacterium]|nr:hypothetical protein [Bacillota bacterium]
MRLRCDSVVNDDPAGGPVVPADVGPPREEVGRALRGAEEVRRRYTVMQLADELGWLDEIAGEVEGCNDIA